MEKHNVRGKIILIYCVKSLVTHRTFNENKIHEMLVLLGVGSTDIFSPIWKSCAINPKSQVAKQCKTARNRTAAFDLWAAEHRRQLRLLLSLAAPLIFTKMTTAAEICCHRRIWAGFAHPWGPPSVVLSLLATRIFCLHLDSEEANTMRGKTTKHKMSSPGKKWQIK